MRAEPFPLIVLEGPPEARGRSYGRAARRRIARSVEIYQDALGALGLGSAARARLLARMAGIVETFDPTHLAEMRGIAEGAGVTLADILLVNCRTEMLQLAADGGRLEDEPDGCTGLVVMPEASADGRLIHAQNWDWRADCVETAVVLMIRRDDGPDILTFTEAGALARTGLNAAGIAISANYLESDRDYRRLGVPLPLIRRRALEQEHFALAIRAVACTPKSASNNMLLSHGGGVAIDLECAPDEAFAIHPEAGLLVHANHWVSPSACAKLRDTGLGAVPDSLYRDRRVRDHLARLGRPVGVSDVKEALADDFGTPHAVCRPVTPGVSGVLTATVATIVMRPDEGRMEVAPLPASNREFTAYALGDRTRRAA